jgi:hypothetical protein
VGLIKSTNTGKGSEILSRAGESDFHAVTAADTGATWAQAR